MRLTVVNWKKYNAKRKDVIKNSWFKVTNDFLERPDMLELTNDEKIVWLHILSSRSSASSDEFRVSVKRACFVCSVTEPTFRQTISKLQYYEMIEVIEDTSHARNVHVTDTLRTRDADVTLELELELELEKNTNQNSEIQNTTTDCASASVSGLKNEQPDIKPKRKPRAAPKEKTNGSKVWEAYTQAHKEKHRYARDLPGSGKANTICKRLAENYGVDNAIQIAKIYLKDNDPYITKQCHPIALLESRANKYMVEINQKSGNSTVDQKTKYVRLDGPERVW